MSPEIRMLTPDELDAYSAHIGRHALESGTDGDPIFMPYGAGSPFDAEKGRERRLGTWSTPIGEPEWARCWGLFDDDRVVGHCELTSMFVRSTLHRANLGMGLERSHRGQGYGRALLEAALDFARSVDFLEWVDLGVFEGNDTAMALYLATGFEETGRVADRFRIDGQRVGDISMTLRVGG